jgi:hypothetical protein
MFLTGLLEDGDGPVCIDDPAMSRFGYLDALGAPV